MPLEFSTATQEAHTSGIKVLVYGDSGLGKTVLCATMPKPLLISAESGTLSLRKDNLERIFGVDHPLVEYNMPIIKIRNVGDLVEALEFCKNSAHAKHFQSFALDSLSEIAEVVLNNAKKQVKDPRQAYGELIEKMETTIRAFRDIPEKNVLMVAKMEPMRDELSGIVTYGPSMPGAKLSVKLPYFFDEVFRLAVGKTPQGAEYRYLQTQPDLKYQAKDRSGALDKVEYPFLTTIFNKIKG